MTSRLAGGRPWRGELRRSSVPNRDGGRRHRFRCQPLGGRRSGRDRPFGLGAAQADEGDADQHEQAENHMVEPSPGDAFGRAGARRRQQQADRHGHEQAGLDQDQRDFRGRVDDQIGIRARVDACGHRQGECADREQLDRPDQQAEPKKPCPPARKSNPKDHEVQRAAEDLRVIVGRGIETLADMLGQDQKQSNRAEEQ
jgi:hypothetical protein